MAFNQTLEGSVRFSQPVQAPSALGAVESIIGGLGVFDRQEQRQPTQDERRTRTFRQFTQEYNLGDIAPSELTSQQLRLFERFSPGDASWVYSQSSTALDFAEQSGGVGATAARAERDSFIEWSNSPLGIVSQNIANSLFPNDPDRQALYVQQARLDEAASVSNLTNLTRRVESGEAVASLSDQAWEAQQSTLSTAVAGATLAMQEAFSGIALGETIPLANIAPDLVPLVGNITITRQNFSSSVGVIRDALVRHSTNQLRTQFPGQDIRPPSQAYIDNLFSGFNTVATALAEENDPSNLLQFLQSTEGVALYQSLEGTPASRLIALGRIAPSLSEHVLARGSNFVEAYNVLGQFVAGQTFNDVAESNSPATIRSAVDGTLGILSDMNRVGRELTTQESSQVNSIVEQLPAMLAGDRRVMDAGVYSSIIGPNTVRALTPESRVAVAQAFQSDLIRDIDRLQQRVRGVSGGLTFENGRFSFSSNNLVGLRGDETRELSPLLDRLNAKVNALSSTAGVELFGEGFVEAITAETGETFGFNAVASNQTTLSAGPTSFEPPTSGTQVMENVYSTQGMNPLLTSLEGASSMTREYASERMTQVLQGPFQEMQRIFGRAVTINDGIAREGTSREQETQGSRHFHGDAIDVDISGLNDQERLELVSAAMDTGFQGFGFGNNILHIDMGERRAWGYGNDTFGGRQLPDLIEAVRNNTTTATLSAANSDSGTLGMVRATLVERSPEYDDNEGLARNTVYFDEPAQPSPTQVEQETPLAQTTADQFNTSVRSTEDEVRRAPVSEEITALIQELSNREDRDTIIEFLRGLSDEAEE